MVPSKIWHRCRREPFATGSQQYFKLLQERISVQWCTASPYTVAGDDLLPVVHSKALQCCWGEPFSVVPSKTLDRCRREPSANGSQQGLKLLQERTFLQWMPPMPMTGATLWPSNSWIESMNVSMSRVTGCSTESTIWRQCMCMVCVHWLRLRCPSGTPFVFYKWRNAMSKVRMKTTIRLNHRTCCHVFASVLACIPTCSGGGWPIGGVELPLAKRCTSPTSKNLNDASRPMIYGFL